MFAPLRSIAHGLVSKPLVYDAVQWVAGSRRCYARLSRLLPDTAQQSVLDAGGGTGRSLAILHESARYVAADLDIQKLTRLRQKHGTAVPAVASDIGTLPMRPGAFDLALLVFVCHHLSDGALAATLRELARVCRGRVFIMDPVWVPERWRSRVLWQYDEGKYPRTAAALRRAIESAFTIEHEEQFAVHHRYYVWQCQGRP